MATRRRKPRLGTTGCLFWMFILLVIVVIFVFRSKGNLKNPFAVLKKLKPSGQEEVSAARDTGGKKAAEPTAPGPSSATEAGPKPSASGAPSATPAPAKPSGEKPPGRPPKSDAPKPSTAPSREQPAVRSKKLAASVYFVKISSEDGSVSPVAVPRTVEYVDSPLTRTMESLLAGPTEAERMKGLISLIPDGTRLLGARIDGGRLTLNFSHHFEENYTGREAILLELAQVMLTSFEFSQVGSVSLLIEGKPKRYITGEGIPLKEAYTRQDLASFDTKG